MTEPSTGDDGPSGYGPLTFDDDLAEAVAAHRRSVLGLISDALTQHEITCDRPRLAREVSPDRARAVVAALALDHVVLPARAVRCVVEDYARDYAETGNEDAHLSDLTGLFRAATGWSP